VRFTCDGRAGPLAKRYLFLPTTCIGMHARMACTGGVRGRVQLEFGGVEWVSERGGGAMWAGCGGRIRVQAGYARSGLHRLDELALGATLSGVQP